MFKNKKGFTIVELVIVIAVIAILAAVLIPTFSGIIAKANLSNDVQTARNMNTKLAIDYPDNYNYAENVNVVKESLSQYKNSFKPKSNEYHYYWCEIDNNVYLINDINKFNIYFPETNTDVTSENSYRLDKEYYSITCDIEGVTTNKKVVEQGSANVEVTLIVASGNTMPSKVKIGDTEYTVSSNKIIIDKISSNIVLNEVEAPVDHYLTFTANTAGSTIKFNPKSGTWQYSTDKTNWTDGTSDTTITLTNVGDKVYFKGENCVTGFTWINPNPEVLYNFTMTGSISASGDVTSLTNGVGGDATLTNSCYLDMFKDCVALTTAPNLPSTTLADACYNQMFYGCSNLTNAPDLPATTLTETCYYGMFRYCTSLTSAPNLPATEFPTTSQYGSSCYNGMFDGCIKLKVCEDEVPSDCTQSGVILTCPSYDDYTGGNVYEMFGWSTYLYGEPSTDRVSGNPESGKTYYWYTTNSSNYTISFDNNGTDITADSLNPTTIAEDGSVTLKFTSDSEEIEIKMIAGAKYDAPSFDNNNKTLTVTIHNPTGNVSVSVHYSCFVAGTQITMANGTTKNIEDIKVGDKVLAYDTIKNETYETVVLKTFEHISTCISTITLSDGTIVECTPTHPILTLNGFKSVNPNYNDVMKEYASKQLKVGDMVVTEKGTFAVVSIEIENKAVSVYNFHVQSNGYIDNSTYIANGIVVHNTCAG